MKQEIPSSSPGDFNCGLIPSINRLSVPKRPCGLSSLSHLPSIILLVVHCRNHSDEQLRFNTRILLFLSYSTQNNRWYSNSVCKECRGFSCRPCHLRHCWLCARRALSTHSVRRLRKSVAECTVPGVTFISDTTTVPLHLFLIVILQFCMSLGRFDDARRHDTSTLISCLLLVASLQSYDT